MEHLWWNGRLIENTDMHLGNRSFRVGLPLRLAPTYDMLPMMYAPLPGGEVPAREFVPALPLPTQRMTWLAACAAAIEFWTVVQQLGVAPAGLRRGIRAAPGPPLRRA